RTCFTSKLLLRQMARILIIGYGNPFKSDDGLGWHAAGLLRQQFSSSDIRVVQTHQLTPEMAEEASEVELALFIDARQGGQPGQLACETLSENAQPTAGYSHDFSPASILNLARELYGKQPRAYLRRWRFTFRTGFRCAAEPGRENQKPHLRGMSGARRRSQKPSQIWTFRPPASVFGWREQATYSKRICTSK